MIEVYYVYLGENGWWGQAGQATSELSRAMQFEHGEALRFCRRRYDAVNNTISAVPVRRSDALEVMQ